MPRLDFLRQGGSKAGPDEFYSRVSSCVISERHVRERGQKGSEQRNQRRGNAKKVTAMRKALASLEQRCI